MNRRTFIKLTGITLATPLALSVAEEKPQLQWINFDDKRPPLKEDIALATFSMSKHGKLNSVYFGKMTERTDMVYASIYGYSGTKILVFYYQFCVYYMEKPSGTPGWMDPDFKGTEETEQLKKQLKTVKWITKDPPLIFFGGSIIYNNKNKNPNLWWIPRPIDLNDVPPINKIIVRPPNIDFYALRA